MASILVLEDNEERTKVFKRELIGHEAVFCVSASEAIKELEDRCFDAVFLDHDLGGKVFVEETENTGYEVCLWLEKNTGKKPKIIIIHSLNPSGVKRMLQAVPDALEIPFAWARAADLLEKAELI